MQLMLQSVQAAKIKKMIDDRLEKSNQDYYLARGAGDKNAGEIAAGVKWELAELKMQFVDLLIKQADEEPENFVTN